MSSPCPGETDRVAPTGLVCLIPLNKPAKSRRWGASYGDQAVTGLKALASGPLPAATISRSNR